jgi:viologen exporter family transport system permease protein
VIPYVATMSARFRMLLQYRAAALAGFATQLFWGFLKIMVLEAFYAGATTPPPMSFREVVSYVWLGQAMLTFLPWNVDADIRQMVRSGGLVYELLRPVDVYNLWYARTLALRTAPMLLRAVPMFLFAGVVLPLVNPAWSLAPPPSIASGIAWVCSMTGSLLLGCAITALMHASLPFTVAADGVVRFVPALVLVFSGMIAPLPLFPDWLQPWLDALPFRWLADMPFRVYTGHVRPIEGLRGCAIQLVWTAVILGGGRWLLGRGLRRAELFGG